MEYSVATGSMSRQVQFTIALVVALLLHLTIMTAATPAPEAPAEIIPTRTLSVTLGNALSGEQRRMVEQAQAPLAPQKSIQETINELADAEATGEELMQEALPLKPTAKQDSASAAPRAALKNKTKSKGQMAKTYVKKRREVNPQAATEGNMLGNTQETQRQIMANYAQTISLWMNKFKIYPKQAQDAGMQGRAVVRIRLDQRGQVHYRILTEHTPYPILDKAVLDAARRANPFPPIPQGYPTKDGFAEFMIPVAFTLD